MSAVLETPAASAARSIEVRWLDRVWSGLLWGLITFFVVNIFVMIAAVATNSFARRWLASESVSRPRSQ